MRIAAFSGQWEGRTVDSAFPLVRFLGAGESSAVFLTSYEARQAAIKLVHTEPQSADAQLCRWRSASKLSHPNLIRIFTTGRCELDGIALLYVVMELAEEDLSQVVPDRALTAVEARAMLEPTLAALDYIHRQGFLHGHLKPANIMAANDQVKLSSDGLCRVGVNWVDLPSPYDAPERAKGVTSPAGDIWSLGVTLVEVLTQRPPGDPRGPSGLPEPFAAIALHSADRNAADRWTIPQILQRLGTPAPVAIRKRRSFAPVGVLVLLLLLIILVVGVIVKHSEAGAAPTSAPPPAASQPAPTASGETAKAPEPEPAKTVSRAKPARATQAPEAVTPQSTDQPMPDLTPQALRTIHGKVKVNVRVAVDPSGTVTDAKLEYAGSSKYLAASALKAARQWKFKPVAVDGRDAAQQWRVEFEFRSSGTKAVPRRLSP